jgi:hypothetical protein
MNRSLGSSQRTASDIPRSRASCYDRAMRISVPSTLFAVALASACGGPKHKDTSIVNEGSDVPTTCCCKTTPQTSDEGQPTYAMAGRMECSSDQGSCVPDVQCNASTGNGSGSEPASKGTGVPPPPGAPNDPSASPLPR